MKRHSDTVWFLEVAVLSFVLTTYLSPAFGRIERCKPAEPGAIELWRITNDPTVQDHANYHNTQCWSPDGRYICYTHSPADENQSAAQAADEVHLYDLHNNKDIKVDNGINPRWANNHNWLFYARIHPHDDPSSRHLQICSELCRCLELPSPCALAG